MAESGVKDSILKVLWLGTKEWRSLRQDTVMLALMGYMFTMGVYMDATAMGDDVHNASLAVVDEDRSALSGKIADGFYPPYFKRAASITAPEVADAMARGEYMFVLDIPRGFEADARTGRQPTVFLHIDATAAQQAGLGAAHASAVVQQTVQEHLHLPHIESPIKLVLARAFNPSGLTSWFHGIASFLDHITMVIIVLTGAALLREREHGTIEHLLVMPLSAFQIALAKIGANAVTVLVIALCSLLLVVRGALGVPVAGTLPLFIAGLVVYLFAAASIGVLLATIARSMAQFSLLIIITILPMQMLSGGMSPVENQPDWLQWITQFFPSRQFMAFSQGVIYRGARFADVWQEFAAMAGLGTLYLWTSLRLFKRSIETA